MGINNTCRLIMADDHILLRDALTSLINSFEGFSVEAVAGNGKEVIQLIREKIEVDIILMDLNMPEMDGYETAKWLAKNKPHVKIIVLTMFDSEMAIIRLLQFGVYGFLKKDIHPDELRTALLTVASGEYYYRNHTTLKLINLFRKNANEESDQNKILLTETEIEFLKLASREMTYREIGMSMNLTQKKIDTYRDTLFFKLNVKSRVGLVIYAVKSGIVSF